MEKKILIVVVVFISLLCILLCTAGIILAIYYPTFYNNLLENSSLQVGTEAPDFELTTILGEKVRLSQLKGQPVILTIGASWCPDCQREAAFLQSLHEARPDLPIIMVDTKEDISTINEFIENLASLISLP